MNSRSSIFFSSQHLQTLHKTSPTHVQTSPTKSRCLLANLTAISHKHGALFVLLSRQLSVDPFTRVADQKVLHDLLCCAKWCHTCHSRLQRTHGTFAVVRMSPWATGRHLANQQRSTTCSTSYICHSVRLALLLDWCNFLQDQPKG